jgi:acid phosphatase family membrane protein YuiD
MTDMSPYLVAIVAAWLLSHVIKYIIALSQGKQLNLSTQLFISGGMPSSHSATVLAAWTVILLKDGWDSGLFGLATALVLVVIYDAAKVRRSSGEQGDSIIALIKATKAKVIPPRVARGHTPLEVLVGAVFGVFVGAISFLLLQ